MHRVSGSTELAGQQKMAPGPSTSLFTIVTWTGLSLQVRAEMLQVQCYLQVRPEMLQVHLVSQQVRLEMLQVQWLCRSV